MSAIDGVGIPDKQYTLYWRDGTKEVITGPSLPGAIVKAGYGNGAIGALSFWADGDDKGYVFDKDKRRWMDAN